MSNEENTNQTIENTKEVASNITAKLLELKEKNPKVFFGGIGAGAVILILLMMSGGNSETSSGSVMKNLVIGQSYQLKSANAYDKEATVRLVSVPGTIAAYDDTEEADRNGVCQHLAQGTPVTVTELQDAYGKKNAYAKVQVMDGDCKDNSGWALSIDVQ